MTTTLSPLAVVSSSSTMTLLSSSSSPPRQGQMTMTPLTSPKSAWQKHITATCNLLRLQVVYVWRLFCVQMEFIVQKRIVYARACKCVCQCLCLCVCVSVCAIMIYEKVRLLCKILLRPRFWEPVWENPIGEFCWFQVSQGQNALNGIKSIRQKAGDNVVLVLFGCFFLSKFGILAEPLYHLLRRFKGPWWMKNSHCQNSYGREGVLGAPEDSKSTHTNFSLLWECSTTVDSKFTLWQTRRFNLGSYVYTLRSLLVVVPKEGALTFFVALHFDWNRRPIYEVTGSCFTRTC